MLKFCITIVIILFILKVTVLPLLTWTTVFMPVIVFWLFLIFLVIAILLFFKIIG